MGPSSSCLTGVGWSWFYITPWLLHQPLLRIPAWVPALTSFGDEKIRANVSILNLFLLKQLYSQCPVTITKTPDFTPCPLTVVPLLTSSVSDILQKLLWLLGMDWREWLSRKRLGFQGDLEISEASKPMTKQKLGNQLLSQMATIGWRGVYDTISQMPL